MGLNLITRSEYKTYAGINSPNQDDEIDTLIPKVSEFVKTYCRQTFVDNYDEAKFEIQHGGSDILYLHEHPIVEIQAEDFSSNYGQTYSALTKFTDWVWDAANQGVRSLSERGFEYNINGYRIKYTCGYETVPQDLKLAIMDMVTYYRRNDGSVHSTKAPGTNSVQIEYISTTTLPAHIKRVLDLYMANYA